MFAKLKQKIAEEECSSGDVSRPTRVSPAASVRRARVNGWTENKWERRRLSNASSLNESRESLSSDRGGYSSGYNVSRHASFTTRPSSSLAGTPVDPQNGAIGGHISHDEILDALSKKAEHITKLEAKIADMANSLKEQSRSRENLEEALEREREGNAKRFEELRLEHEKRLISVKTEYDKAIAEKNEELNSKLRALSLENSRYTDMNELNTLQQQELAKMKSTFIQYQTEATRNSAENLEKSKQLEDLDQAYADQRSELASLQDRLDDLARERTKYEARDRQQYNRISTLEKEGTSLKSELHNTVSELTQKSVQSNRLEKTLTQTEEELNNVRQSYTLYKNKVSSDLEDKKGQISRLKERVGDLERRLEDSKLSGDDQVKALGREREVLETRLKETRTQIAELKTSTTDRISTLGSLVSTLNERLESKEAELTQNKHKYDESFSSLQTKIKSLEGRLANTNELITDTRNSDDGKIKALKQQNAHLEKELEDAWKNFTSGIKSEEEKSSFLESQLKKLESIRERERTELQEKLDQLKVIENEYSNQEDAFNKKFADLEEDKEQLQNELNFKAEEYIQVSLCMEDAMAKTNELKSQIGRFEETLKQKDDMLTVFKENQFDSPSCVTSATPEALQSLRGDLENTKVRYQNAKQALVERDETITELRRIVQDKIEELNRSTTKVKQYEENNRFARSDRIHPYADSRGSYKVVEGLKQQVKDLQQQLQEREMLQLDENELRDLRKDNVQLETELEDKDKKVKLLQSKVLELKKAFQRELKMPVPGHANDVRSPSSSSSDGSEQERDRLDFLEINFKYLKHVILKYMCSTNIQSRQLINVIGHLLRFTPKEEQCVRNAIDWKLPIE